MAMNESLPYSLNNDIQRSLNDKRTYRAITLPNGLRALLVSDLHSYEDGPSPVSSEDEAEMEEDISEGEESDADSEEGGANKRVLSAAALCIGVGSFSDPADIPGLAHFLEHMVFMGSEKYPDENSFDSFLKSHGGSNNAYTDCERTVFYFDIEPAHLEGGLDRFAQFFIKPLMKQDSVDREVKAVDSEFDMAIPRDGNRKEQLLGTLAKQDHPMGKFMWGNFKSLSTVPKEKGIDIYQRLQEFHKHVYSSKFMTLCVQSAEELDDLEDMVTKIFSPVVDNQMSPPTFKDLISPFETDNFHKLYKIVPVKDTHQVEVTWALPSLQGRYLAKPLNYLGWLVGHESAGGILSHLKKQLWATSLTGGNGESGWDLNSTCSLFAVTVTLTEEGLDNVDKVLSVIFQYLKMLQKSGPVERIHNEIKKIEDTDFRWEEQSDPADFVVRMVENMQQYPPQHYITGDRLVWEWDPQLIAECQNALRHDNCSVSLTSKRFEAECDRKEPWFGTQYRREDLPEQWLADWRDREPAADFHVPPENPFIATNFELVGDWKPDQKHPVVIHDSPKGKVWYKGDAKFHVPKAYLHFWLLSPVVRRSVTDNALYDLYLQVLDHRLKEIVYHAQVAQLSYSVLGNEAGIVIKCGGFNDKLLKLLDAIVSEMTNFKLTEEEFAALRQQLIRTYYNEFIKTEKVVRDVRLALLDRTHCNLLEKHGAMLRASRADLQRFVADYQAALYLQGLLHGNLPRPLAAAVVTRLQDSLAYRALPPDQIPDPRTCELPLGAVVCGVEGFNRSDNNSAVTNYYQHGPADLRQAVCNELLSVVMEEPVFDVLRTQQQLGYSVSCMNRNTHGVLGLSVSVRSQANKFTESDVDSRIEDFLKVFEEKLEKIGRAHV